MIHQVLEQVRSGTCCNPFHDPQLTASSIYQMVLKQRVLSLHSSPRVDYIAILFLRSPAAGSSKFPESRFVPG